MEICELSAAAQAAAIRDRELSSREVVTAHLERIEAVNPAINALRVVLAEQALAAADEADRTPAAGPLHGVPISIKENVDVAGTATTWGVPALQGAVSPLDAPVVANLKRAGAIVLGRGNMADFALRWHTESALAGATINPRDRAVTPGGSSGGEAAALATGMIGLAVGNDLGGSLRFPSQCCGTVALKPSFGRIPDAGLIPTSENPLSVQQFNVQGPMARTVEDLRLALDVMAAPSPRDPGQVPGGKATGARRVSVAIPDDTAPSIAAAVRTAADALAAAGYDIVEAMPPAVEDAAQLWSELLIDDVRRGWDQMAPLAGEGARSFMAQVIDATPDVDYPHHWIARQAIARAWSEHNALILAPVCLQEPFAPGADLDDVSGVLASMRLVVPANLLGLPAVAVAGVQVIGPRFAETLCLDVAAAIEAEIGETYPIDPRETRERV
jgi:amidase